MPLGGHEHLDIDSIPTGSLSLDLALGIRGLPRGRIIEIYGAEIDWQNHIGATCSG